MRIDNMVNKNSCLQEKKGLFLEDNSNTEKPDSISESHWKEWLNSGVEPRIIELNVRSVYDSWEIDKLLNRNNKKRFNHSENLVPAWRVSGIEPFSGEKSLLGLQVKPDISPVNKEGKKQKYLGASGYNVAPLFLNVGLEGYWQSIISNISIPLTITEGAKKAGCLLSNNYAAISIPGVSTCRKNGRLHHWIQPFTGFGRIIYLVFDNDSIYKKPVQESLLGMGRELRSTGSKVMVVKLPPGEAKGVDDFIAMYGKAAYQEILDEAVTIEEFKLEVEEQWRNQSLGVEEERKSKLFKYMDIVRQGWGDGLRLNKLKNTIELHGKEVDLNLIRLRIALEFDVDVPIGDAQGIVEKTASENTYHPVIDYLDTLSLMHPDADTSILNNLASRYFGSNEPIYNIYMLKTLVAAVARVREPGCKHDTATILAGKQGTYKSTFWRKLFGDDWFSDELGDASEKDELMKLHRFWGLEWSEFETVYRKKDIASLKKFMSSTVDAFRVPYGRVVKEFPRTCVLVGTTNEDEILPDSTGSRRFWVIPVQGQIPINQLVQDRDKIWAAADALYRSGFKWYLTPEEAEIQSEANLNFEVEDPWLSFVSTFVRGRDYVLTSEVLGALGVDTPKLEIPMSKRVGAILRRLKFKRTRQRINGVNQRCWIPEQQGEQSEMPTGRGIEELETEAVPLVPPENTNFLVNAQQGEQLQIPIETGIEELEAEAVPLVPPENANFSRRQYTQNPKYKKYPVKGFLGEWTCFVNSFNQGFLSLSLSAPWRSQQETFRELEIEIPRTRNMLISIIEYFVLQEEASIAIANQETFKVDYFDEENCILITGCKMVKFPQHNNDLWFEFETPGGKKIRTQKDGFMVES